MRSTALFSFALFVSSFLSGCAASNNQDLAGGYSMANTSDPAVIAAAEFAVADRSKIGTALKLVKVTGAQSQVVAGTNYQIEMLVDDSGTTKPVEVVVYEDLTQTRSLSAWVWK